LLKSAKLDQKRTRAFRRQTLLSLAFRIRFAFETENLFDLIMNLTVCY
jgi:hypothetical protein